MDRNRGLCFLVGIFSLYLLWQFRNSYILQEYVFQEYQTAYGAPIGSIGAAVVGFIIEAVIAIGAVIILVVSGLWQGAVVLFGLLSETAVVLKSYLVAGQKSAEEGLDKVKEMREAREAEAKAQAEQEAKAEADAEAEAEVEDAPLPQLTPEQENHFLRLQLLEQQERLEALETKAPVTTASYRLDGHVRVVDLNLTEKVIESLELHGACYTVTDLRDYVNEYGNFEGLPVIGKVKSDEIIELIS